MKKKRVNIFSLLFGVLIDLALMGMGVALYIHFQVYSFGPIGLSPLVIELFGSQTTAVLVISGVPFIVGAFNLLKTFVGSVTRRPAAQTNR